jgi:hypothetical protein
MLCEWFLLLRWLHYAGFCVSWLSALGIELQWDIPSSAAAGAPSRVLDAMFAKWQ